MVIDESNFTYAHAMILGEHAPMTDASAHRLALRMDQLAFSLLQVMLVTPDAAIVLKSFTEQVWMAKTPIHSWLHGRDFASITAQRAEATAVAADPAGVAAGRRSLRLAWPMEILQEAGIVP